MRYDAVNITTAVMFGLTVYTMVSRFRGKPQANWPLFYYLFLVAYHQAYAGNLNPYPIYTGVVSGLLIRFEFMSRVLSRALHVIEFTVLAFLSYSFLVLVVG